MGNGGWTDGYKITKANDYLLKKDIYSSEWEIGDFCPRNPRNSWRLCVWDERGFFSPTFSISSKFLVEERSSRGLTVRNTSAIVDMGFRDMISGCFLLALTFALEIQPTCKQGHIAYQC